VALRLWLGFPKSLDISKAIDKKLGAEREVVGIGLSGKSAGMQNLGPSGIKGGSFDITAPATELACKWDGWGTCLKPANEPLIWATKSLTPVLEDGIIFLENILGVILCQLLNAKYVEQILMSNLQGSPEDVFDFVLWIVEEKITNGKEKQSPKMDIFKSRETERIFWNIVTLWRNISEENFQLGNTSTISMETNKITELKILKSWVLESIFQNTTLANECSVDGLMSYATSVVMNSNEGKLKLKHILKHSVPENAILKIGVNVALELVNFVVWSSTTLIQTENTVLPNVITLPEWERVVKEKLLSVDFVDRNLKQLFQETLNTVIESVCQEPSPANEPIVLARKPISEKTIAENVMKWGTGGLNIDGCRIPTDETITNHSRSAESAKSKGKYGDSKAQETHQTQGQKLGRFPANCVTTEPDAFFSKYFNITPPELCKKASKQDRNSDWRGEEIGLEPKDSGSLVASTRGQLKDLRISNPEYERKVPKNANFHPTVKPTDLMAWLVRLVTPPGGIVLDPFAGSGSTLVAAKREGFQYIGIEREAEYVEIAKARVG
jgi:hypothetical protein